MANPSARRARGKRLRDTDLSTQILNNPELKQKLLGELVQLIYRRDERVVIGVGDSPPFVTFDGHRAGGRMDTRW